MSLFEPDLSSYDEAQPGTGAVGPPTALLALLALELAICAALWFVDSKPVHVVGYVLGAVIVAVTVVAYRSVDRTRRRSPRYVIRPGRNSIVTTGLVLGIVLAALHAYEFLQETVIQ